jgi:hypothetical protein
VAILSQDAYDIEDVKYIHHDHLGSIQAYSDEFGKLYQELSYDAWGLRRKPETWVVFDVVESSNAYNDHGFGGHEHIDLFELVNMDGRMYDPVVGRFISADPFIQSPDFTQSLNRYAYCINNPLSLIDPSGYSWFSKNWKAITASIVGIAVSVVTAGTATGVGIAIIAGAAGGAAGALTGALLNGANIGQIAKATFIGALVGGGSGFLNFASGGGTVWEQLFKHTFSQGWLEGVQGGNMFHGFMMGVVSGAGGYTINKYCSTWNEIGQIAANSILSGTISEIGGGKFANGAITGAFSFMFNDLMHPKTWHTWFQGKNARHRAYDYMLRRSKKLRIEIAAVNLDDKGVLVYKEVGNTYTSSHNYFAGNSNEVKFIFRGKLHTVLATGQVHTHPYWNRTHTENPLRISDSDINLAKKHFDGIINILLVPTKQLFNVSVNGNGLAFPVEKKW